MLQELHFSSKKQLFYPLDISAYETHAMIGVGGYSVVRLVSLKKTPYLFALKQVALCDIIDEYQLKLAISEIKVFTAPTSFTRLYSSMKRYFAEDGSQQERRTPRDPKRVVRSRSHCPKGNSIAEEGQNYATRKVANAFAQVQLHPAFQQDQDQGK